MSGSSLGLGIIGAGGIARRRMLPALAGSPLVHVAALMNPTGAAEIAAEFGVPHSSTEARDIVSDPRVSAVYIASPVFLHREHIQLAAEAGRHIFCEKPAARTLEETRAAHGICTRHKVRFMEGYMMNFHAAHRVIRGIISAGQIGRPVSMRAQLSCWYPPIDGAWRQDPVKGGGGALIDLATHCFSLLEFLTGDRITGVFAMTTSQRHGYRSEDSATTMLQFASGCHASVDTFFCVRDESSLNRLEIYGDAGSVLAEGTIGQDSGGAVMVSRSSASGGYDALQAKAGESAYRPIPFDPINPYLAEMEEFADCIIRGKDPAINGWNDAGHIAEITEKAYRSWRERRFLEIDAPV